jgi:putative hydrolase of the HAD superfamily
MPFVKPSLVLFDVGSTLVDPHPSARELILRVLDGNGRQVTAADLERVEPTAWQAVRDRLPFHRYGQEESQAFWDAFYGALLSELGVVPSATVRAALYAEFQRIENWRLYPDAVPVLRELRDRGYRLGVVSNWEEWLEELLLALDVHALFDVIVASAPFGRAKPHSSIFQQALSVAGTAPERAVHIGDSPRDDVAGARAVGIRPILVDRRDRFADLEVERVASLSELLNLL